ncbi:MAG: aminotransferase class III-fold pyridoxal phosphate-dependent enzyme [Candidatus Coatesbacteria bacterium]|nr:aminotransferase class III-fold pyridoxal phosphate-dependent enzyme [Candidatus Coatesbacteria bacterium]
MLTAMLTNNRMPDVFHLETGRGCWFCDSSPRESLNFSGSALGLPLGYGSNVVRSAVLEAVETNAPGITGCELEHDICDRLASMLAGFKPTFYDRKALLFPSSDHAIAAAICVAIDHTNRPFVISVAGSSHGRDLQHISYGADPAARSPGLAKANIIHVPFPGMADSVIPDTETFLSHVTEFIFKRVAHPYEIAAIVVPPVAFSDSIDVLSDDLLPGLNKLCLQSGIALIVDETRLAVGVLGKRFASDLWDFQPDILCLGEPCANGLAFGAAIILKSLLSSNPCCLDGFRGGQRLSCAVASAILRQSESTLTAAAKRIEGQLAEELNRLAESGRLIERVSGRGALWSASVADREASDPECLTLRDQVAKAALKRGLYIARTGMHSLLIAPPLVISDGELEQGLHILEEVLAELA